MQGWRLLPHLPLTLLSGQCRRQMGMENDSGLSKTQSIVTPTAAVVPDVVSLPKQINTSFGTRSASIDLENAFFLVSVPKGSKKTFAEASSTRLYIFTSRVC